MQMEVCAFRSLDNALKHFDKLVRQNNVDDLSTLDTELICRVPGSRR